MKWLNLEELRAIANCLYKHDWITEAACEDSVVTHKGIDEATN